MSRRRSSWLLRTPVIAAVTGALMTGVLVGLPPASANSSYGMLVGAVSQPEWGFYAVQFRALPGMVQSDVVVRRTGNSLVIFEEDGGPSLGASTGNSLCTSSNPSGPSSEITCTFPAIPADVLPLAVGDFSQAPRSASLIIEEGSYVRARFIGSPFDDYFQGGDLADYAEGGAGDDNLYGGGLVDTLRGDAGADDIDGEDDHDNLYGGADGDTITGGKGNDTVVAGTGPDNVDAKDSARDVVDCGDPSMRTGTSAEAGDEIEYDEKLDVVTACNAVEWPRPVVPPSLSTVSVKVGEKVTGDMGQWTGTPPLTYTYVFERCALAQYTVWPPTCTVVKSGKLDARGLENGQKPSYMATRADTNHFLAFSVAASTTKPGVWAQAGAQTDKVGPPATETIMGNWLPQQIKGKWVFGDQGALQTAILNSAIGQYVDITATPVRRVSVPSTWRRVITHDSIIELKVNGKPVPVDGRVVVEASADERPTIAIKYYSWWEDRKTCPVEDENIAAINKSLEGDGMPLWLLTGLLDGYAGECKWVINWSDEASTANTFTATKIALEENLDNPDVPVQLRITATKPTLRPRLSLVLGAPPQSHVSQRPDDFSIAVDGRLYDFPGDVFSSIWVGLLGDQAREGTVRGRAELYVNGDRKVAQTFDSSSGQGAPFSTVLSTAALEPGTARIVVSTFANDGAVDSQVYADLTIADGSSASTGNLITWDGRCFATSGRPATCPDSYNGALGAMRNAVNTALNGALTTYAYDYHALRYASEKLDKRFVAVVANGPLSPPGGQRSARARDCWWIDFVCHIQNHFEARAQVVTKPKTTKKIPPLRTFRIVAIIRVGDKSVAAGVVGEGILKVPGVGLINLDGGTLINLDGGTLINLDGGTFSEELSALINLDGGTVVGTNGATVVGLNGATFVGVDVSSIVGTNGGTLISDMGGAFSPLTLMSSRQVRG